MTQPFAESDAPEWGVHVLRPISKPELDGLKELGLSRVSVHLPWRWVESKKEQWDFRGLEHFLAPLFESGIPLQGILGPAMPHLSPGWVAEAEATGATDFVDRFCNYCKAVGRHFPQIHVFRVEDEINAAWGRDLLRTRRRRGKVWTRSAFRRRIVTSAVRAVREERQEAEIRLTLRLDRSSWKRELRGWWKTKLPFDRLGLSLPVPGGPARLAVADPTVLLTKAVNEARTILSGLPRPQPKAIEISGLGFPSVGKGCSPRAQRLYLKAVGALVPTLGLSGMHWGALRDQAHPDPLLGYWLPERERHIGLQYYDGLPKPVFEEFGVLATGGRFGAGFALD